MEKIILPRITSYKASQYDSIVVSSQINIFRNIDGLLFPNKLSDIEQQMIIEEYKKILNSINNSDIIIQKISELSSTEKYSLASDILISEEFIENDSYFFCQKDASWILLPNHYAHFNLYSVDFGFHIKEIYQRLNSIAEIFEENIHFAFHEDFGYITSKIEHLGNGINCQLLLNLSGLELSGKISDLIDVCADSRLILTPFTKDPHSKLYILQNSTSFGISEKNLLSHFHNFISKLQSLELEARKELLEKKEDKEFFIAQVYEMLSKNSLSYNETIELISIIDMINKHIYKISDRILWLEQIYRLKDNSSIFYPVNDTEEINSFRTKIIKQIFNNIVVKK